MKEHQEFSQKLLLLMGLIMLYFTIIYIVPNELNTQASTAKIICFSIVYLPFANWYFKNTFNHGSNQTLKNSKL